MLVGFFLRRIVTVTLCAGAFWLGVKTDRMIQPRPVSATAAVPAAADCAEPAAAPGGGAGNGG